MSELFLILFLFIGPNRVQSLPGLDSKWLVEMLTDSILADVADVDNVGNVAEGLKLCYHHVHVCGLIHNFYNVTTSMFSA